MTHDPLDDLFHACALEAFLEQARLQKAWPEEEATRRRAFLLYEEKLAQEHGRGRSRSL